jgi:hypothetical protein
MVLTGLTGLAERSWGWIDSIARSEMSTTIPKGILVTSSAQALGCVSVLIALKSPSASVAWPGCAGRRYSELETHAFDWLAATHTRHELVICYRGWCEQVVDGVKFSFVVRMAVHA